MRCRGSAGLLRQEGIALLQAQAAAPGNKKERVRKGPLSYAIV